MGAARVSRDAKVKILEDKFPGWAGTFVTHCVMWYVWVCYIRKHQHLLEYQRWPEVFEPRIEDKHGTREVCPLYVMYLGYVLHSCYREFGKSSARKGGPFDKVFDLHHLIAVLLTASSIRYGTWVAGAVTRFLHDPADIFIYWSKLYQALYENGRGSFAGGFFVLVLDSTAFFMGRIVLYGYMNYTLVKMYLNWPSGKFPNDAMISYTAQIVGSVIMLVIQFVFFAGLLRTTIKFWTRNGQVEDIFHDKKKVHKS